jgi:hypothetical protein
MNETSTALPGLVLRSEWAAQLGYCDKTAKRWQDAGKIVVRYLGRQAFVDIEATAARVRGADTPRRGRRAS